MRRRLVAIGSPLLCLFTSGCAQVTIDADGTRHVRGLVVVTLPSGLPDVGADAMRLRSFGLTLTSGHAAASQVTLGYSDMIIAVMRNDSLMFRSALNRAVQEEQEERKSE